MLVKSIPARFEAYDVLTGVGRSRGSVEDGEVSASVSGYRLSLATCVSSVEEVLNVRELSPTDGLATCCALRVLAGDCSVSRFEIARWMKLRRSWGVSLGPR